MPKVTLRFYEELNDFLPRELRKRDFEAPFKDRRSVKDLIEAWGVPHTEVDLILANGQSVDFNYILKDGNRISVYPVFESLNLQNLTHLRPAPLRKTSFIADVNLHELVRYMRALGFDVFFDPSLSNAEVIDIAHKQNRIILTNSRKLLKNKAVSRGIFIRAGESIGQAKRLIDFLDIKDKINPFSRCIRCNSPLKSIDKEKVLDKIPPKAKSLYQEFSYCRNCDKVYWKGSHCERLKKIVEEVSFPSPPRKEG